MLYNQQVYDMYQIAQRRYMELDTQKPNLSLPTQSSV
jgi:hypothetical protein